MKQYIMEHRHAESADARAVRGFFAARTAHTAHTRTCFLLSPDSAPPLSMCVLIFTHTWCQFAFAVGSEREP
jgi:hypothetical protein